MELLQTKDDLRESIAVLMASRSEKGIVHQANRAFNRFVLGQRESQGKRTKVRVAFEVYARKRSGILGFIRLRGRHALLSFPSAEQAELAMATIESVCRAMEGKFLVDNRKP